ncbi:MAG: hypothetical protein QHH09_00320 [Microgenomates group bacterium]|nr:hypothetical protein [Microgenomates group bacterium]
MKRFLNFSQLNRIFFLFFKALKNLKSLVDPSIEGNPYVIDSLSDSIVEQKRHIVFNRRWAIK